MRTPNVLLEIGDNFINVIDCKRHTVKPISPDSLIQCISGSIDRGIINFGRMPNNELGLLEMAAVTPTLEKRAIIFVPGHYAILKTNLGNYNVPLPGMLFGFEWDYAGKILSSYLFCTKEQDTKNITDDTQIYQYPYCHIHTDGNICWGGVELPLIQNVNQLRGLPYLFLDSFHDFNHLNNLRFRDFKADRILEGLHNREILLDDIIVKDFSVYKVISSRFLNK